MNIHEKEISGEISVSMFLEYLKKDQYLRDF